jgi:hypothetical protein
MSTYLPKLKKILILTPNFVGSAFFQRSITLYLNMQGITTKNYDDLARFGPDLNSLIGTLNTSTNSVVARVSPSTVKKFEKYKDSYLKFCNMFFTDIYVINRCFFESAISYCNTTLNDGKLNVYSKKEYLANTTMPYAISKNKFIASLKYFEYFYIWVDTYFPVHKKLNHEDIVYNTDNTYKDIFNLPDNKYSITDYNKINFSHVRDKDLGNYSKSSLTNYININYYIQDLVDNSLLLPDAFPIKKLTLKEKTDNILNFKELLDIYNNYPSNHFNKLTESQITNRIEKEQIFWTT